MPKLEDKVKEIKFALKELHDETVSNKIYEKGKKLGKTQLIFLVSNFFRVIKQKK